MSTAELKELRKEVKWGIDHADEKIVRMMHAMLEVEQDDAWSDKSFVSEMDRRTKEYESGTAKLYTLEEMENNARKAYKQSKK